MTALSRITFVELKLFLREKVALLFVFVLPLVLLVTFGVLPDSGAPQEHLGGQSPAAYVAAIAMGVALALLALTTIPTVLATYREKGILRRLGATPVRPRTLLLAQVFVNLLSVAVVIVALLVLGNVAFDIPLPARPLDFLAAVVLAIASLFAIGLLVAALAPSARAAQGIGMILFFPSMFLSGVYVPRELLPQVLQNIGDFTPMGAGLKALRDAWMGTEPRLLLLAIMAAYAVAAGVVAAKNFRWE